VVHLSYSTASGLYLACLSTRVMVIELNDESGELSAVCDWTTEKDGKYPETNVARCDKSGELVATGGTDGIVQIWRFRSVRDAPLLQTACAKKKEVTDVDFSPDGKLVASVDGSSNCHLWDTTTGELKFGVNYLRAGKPVTLKGVRFVMHTERAAPVLVFGANSGPRDPSFVGIFTTEGNQLGEVSMDKLPLVAMSVDVRGQMAACSLASGGIKVVSLPTLKVLGSAKGIHDLPAPGVALVGEAAMSGVGDRTVNILNIGGSGGGGGNLLYICFVLVVCMIIIWLTMSMGLKGAALQQQGQGEL